MGVKKSAGVTPEVNLGEKITYGEMVVIFDQYAIRKGAYSNVTNG